MNLKRLFKKTLSMVLSLSLILMAYPSAFGNTARLAEIKSLTGDVQIQKGGGERTFSAFVGMPLTQGDTIVTGRDGRVTVKIDDGLEFIVSENSRIVISELMKNQDEEATQLNVQSGGVWSRIKRAVTPSSRYEIKTPTVVMGARGTDFYTRVLATEVDVSVFSGLIAVTGYEVTTTDEGDEMALEILVGADEYIRVVGKPKEIGDFILEAIDLDKLDLFGLETIKALSDEEPDLFEKWVNEDLDRRIEDSREKRRKKIEEKEEEIKQAKEVIRESSGEGDDDAIVFFEEPSAVQQPQQPQQPAPDPEPDPIPSQPVLGTIVVSDFLDGRSEVVLERGSHEEMSFTVTPSQAVVSAESLNEELVSVYLEKVDGVYWLILSSNEGLGATQVRLTATASGYRNYLKVIDVIVEQGEGTEPIIPDEPGEPIIPEGAVEIHAVDWGQGIQAYYHEGTLYLKGTLDGDGQGSTMNNFAFGENGEALSDLDINSVVFVENIKSIGRYAFVHMSIENISLNEGLLLIDEYAFTYNGLTELYIPESVTHINEGAFQTNHLVVIDIASPVLNLSAEGVFTFNGPEQESECITDREELETYLGMWSLHEVDAYTTWYRQDETPQPSLPDEPGDIPIPSIIPETAELCEDIDWGEGVYAYMDTEGDYAELYLFGYVENEGPLRSIRDFTFNANQTFLIQSNIKRVIFVEGIANIGEYAFSGAEIDELSFYADVVSIKRGAFLGNKLEQVEIHSSVEMIGQDAFANNLLTSVMILPSMISLSPEGVFKNNGPQQSSACITDREGFATYSGAWSLYEIDGYQTWYHLEETTLLNGVPFSAVVFETVSWGEGINAYQYEDQLYLVGADPDELAIMNSFVDDPDHAGKFSSILQVYVLSGIENVGDYAFMNAGISLVNLGGTVVEIGFSAFENNNLTSLVVPASVELIKEVAFSQNPLNEVSFLGTSTVLDGYGIFEYEGPDYYVGSIMVSGESLQGVWRIQLIEGNYYEWRKELDGVPSGALPFEIIEWGEGIEAYLLEETLYLASVSPGLKTINNFSMEQNAVVFAQHGIKHLVILDGIGIIGEYAFAGCQLLTVSLPTTLTTIRASAFYTNDLTSVSIPASVTLIEGQAFSFNLLEQVSILGNQVTRIGTDPIFDDNGPNRSSNDIFEYTPEDLQGLWLLTEVDNFMNWTREGPAVP